MPVVREYTSEKPGFPNQLEYLRVSYDFAADTGATGTYDLMIASSRMLIVHAHLTVKTACTSGGSATVAYGVTGSASKFMNATQGAVASLTANATIVPPAVEGTPNVLPFPYLMALNDKLLMTVATAALTAGKIEFVIGYIKP